MIYMQINNYDGVEKWDRQFLDFLRFAFALYESTRNRTEMRNFNDRNEAA